MINKMKLIENNIDVPLKYIDPCIIKVNDNTYFNITNKNISSYEPMKCLYFYGGIITNDVGIGTTYTLINYCINTKPIVEVNKTNFILVCSLRFFIFIIYK